MCQYKCSCGAKVDSMTSYFDIKTNVRKTVCTKCATQYGFTDANKYYAVPFDSLKASQQVRPKPT